MTFAGLAYKMGDIKRAAVKERVAPLTPMFEAALAELSKLATAGVDAGIARRTILEAIQLYRDAIGDDGQGRTGRQRAAPAGGAGNVG